MCQPGAWTPRRLPTRLARFGGFPEREIERVLFPLVNLDPGARQQIVEIAVGQLPYPGNERTRK
jgi:hypothetical protein